MSTVRRFPLLLGALVLVALGLRIAYDVSMEGYPVVGDALTFHWVGQAIADGHFFQAPLPPYGPTAEHPPLFELFLAALDRLGANGYTTHRLVLAAVGSVNVALIGLLGRRLAGSAVGLLGAAIAAVHPLLITADGSLMSETLYGTALLASLLAAVALVRRPRPWRAALLGALLALAALTRGEALVLLVLLLVPAALLASRAGRGRVALVAAGLLAFAVVLAPWTARNLATFSQPVLISTNSNGIFVGANCRDTYYGPLIGSWRYQCYTPRRPGEDEAAYFARQRRVGLRYARDHAGRLPVVVAARLGRELDVFRFGQSLFLNAAEGRRVREVAWGIRFFWLVGLLALGGFVVLVRRRARLALVVLGAPIGMALLVAVATYGGTRFRYAMEPELAILAAVALSAAGQRLGRAGARRARMRPG